MFENRLFFVDKLVSMGARITLCDPHRVIVIGPSPLYGQRMLSPDIRAGMALLIASLCAQGRSTIGNAAEIDRDELLASLKKIAPRLLPFSDAVWKRLDDARRSGKRILFEGAQGAMLDIDHGTYPYVTSSNTVAAQAMIGSGMGNGAVGYVLGIAKAYTTRVGAGPFPTELTDEIGQGLGDRGKEFGTNTGRRRRCGWFDAVMVRQAVKLNGIDGIALTKLDVLDGMDEIKVCVGYEVDGKRIERFPFTMGAQAKLKPIYETFDGWSESTQGARSFAELPATCIKYVRRVEELVGCPVALLSTSPQREDTILMTDPFRD